MSDLLRPVSTPDLAASAGRLREALRQSPPLTHCVTNAVVTGFTANVLLALGAAPAMVDIVGEAEMFADPGGLRWWLTAPYETVTSESHAG